MQMETKVFPFELDADALDAGIIKGIAAVCGNLDTTGDRIMSGAFTKTIAERGDRLKVGWQHDIDHPFAVPTKTREVPRSELPASVLAMAPDATGGLYVEAEIVPTTTNQERKMLMTWKASNGRSAVDGLSIGYRAVQEDFKSERGVRRLPEIKLYEWSPVTLGANEAAMPTDVKRLDTSGQAAEDEVNAVDPEQKAELTPAQKALRELLQRKASGETFDYLRQRVQDALEDAYPYNAGGYDYWGCPMMQQESDGPGCCIRDLYGDAVIVMDRDWDALWEIPFTLAANGDVTLDTAAARLVKVTYAPIPMTGEEAEKAIVDLAEVKAGRRNSRPDETRLKGAHDALHDVLNMPHHDMGGDSGSGDAEPDADDSAGEKAMMVARLKMIESRVRAASAGAA